MTPERHADNTVAKWSMFVQQLFVQQFAPLSFLFLGPPHLGLTIADDARMTCRVNYPAAPMRAIKSFAQAMASSYGRRLASSSVPIS
jgi:hypothetical protein